MDAGRVDFTSALYLGMRHPAHSLRGWDDLTLGKPAALHEPPGALKLARGLAALMDCAAATVLSSTLHLFWDLFGMLAQEAVVILVDGAAYPVARWGAARAAALGVPVCRFRGSDAGEAARLAQRWTQRGLRPVLLADGYTPGAAQAPPLADYADLAQRHRGWLVLDDTQVLGLRGPAGGGSVAACGLRGAPVLVGASLAKAFGAPLAVLAADLDTIGRFVELSETRLHASPPSVAAIAAALQALRLNQEQGDALRATLAQRTAALRGGLAEAGLHCRGGQFPLQLLPLSPGLDGDELLAALAQDGVDVLLQQNGSLAHLTFLLRADHRSADIARAVAALKRYSKEAA